MKGIIRSNSKRHENEVLRVDKIKNSEEIIIKDVEKQLTNWSIFKVSKYDIYEKRNFIFISDYVIKIVEQTISVTKEDGIFQLLSWEMLEYHIKRKYKYLHVGLVHVAPKPLTKTRLNTFVIVCLRDNRHNEYKYSLLKVVKSGSCDGLIYFKYFS